MNRIYYILNRALIETSQLIYATTIIIAVTSSCYVGWKEISGTAHESFKTIYYQPNSTALSTGEIKILSAKKI